MNIQLKLQSRGGFTETSLSSDADTLLTAAYCPFLFSFDEFRLRLLSGTCLVHKVKRTQMGCLSPGCLQTGQIEFLYLSGFFYRIYFKI